MMLLDSETQFASGIHVQCSNVTETFSHSKPSPGHMQYFLSAMLSSKHVDDINSLVKNSNKFSNDKYLSSKNTWIMIDMKLRFDATSLYDIWLSVQVRPIKIIVVLP